MRSLIRNHTILLIWAQKRLSERQFLILSSALIGLTAGIFALILKSIVHFIHGAVININPSSLPYLYVFFPLGGLLLTTFYVQRFHKGALEKGTAFVLYSISRKSSLLAPLHMVAHIITSSITIGLGGSSGLEAPIATTGAAVGSNYSRVYRLNYKQRTLLLACGTAAGIASVFNAPIAGVLFAIEVLLIDLSATAFIPLIIAAAVGALCSNVVLGDGILLSFAAQKAFNFRNVPYYVLLAILTGLIAVYHSKMFLKIDGWFEKIKSPFTRPLVGGLILAGLIFFFPPLFGEGYDSIIALSMSEFGSLFKNSALADWATNHWLVLAFLLGICVTKTIATSVTLSGGGNGGNFAPSLMVGAFTGMFFSHLINLTGLASLPESNFTLVAMAGVMSGVMHAPLTAIFLIAEITGGYGLMIPLMIVGSVSYSIVKFLDPESIDTKKLAKKGEQIIHDRDRKILSSLSLVNMIETNFQSVPENATLRELIRSIEKSTRNIFPVVTPDNKLVGIIHMDSIREIMFHQEMYDVMMVKELMQLPPTVIEADESMESAMQKFDDTLAWNLPVVSKDVYLGFISKSRIFNKYRNHLIERSVH